jgi:hypothetical protein
MRTASGLVSENTGSQMRCRRYYVGLGAAESTPVETAVPADSRAESVKRVEEPGGLGA